MTTLSGYINIVSKNKLTWYMEQNKTKEEEEDYYASDDYEIHLNYLIETWVSSIENDWRNTIDNIECKNDDFEYISQWYDNGFYWPEFNDDWLDDIFVRHILVTTICLK